MHVSGDLGFSSFLVLVVVTLLALATGFAVIRRKWRLRVARQEEIRRLLAFAAEEAARAELEATYAVIYAEAPVPKTNTYQCAVCYSPTTTRCSQCKAVRYCSGKCQIIHWRQGHREECRPHKTSYNNDDASGTGSNMTKHEQYRSCSDRCEDEPIETSSKESVLSSVSHSPEVPLVKDDNVKVDSDADADVVYATSELSASSFSGWSTPPSGGQSYDEISVGESTCSSETDGSDRHIAADIAPDMYVPRSSNMDQIKPSSPKFSNLVNSVDKFNKLKRLDHRKPYTSERDNEGTYSDNSISTMCNDPIPKPSKLSPDFWGRTLESNVSGGNAQNGSAMSGSGGAVDGKLTNSESFHFKFHLSGNTCGTSHEQSTAVNGTMLNDAPQSALGISKSVKETALSEGTSVDVLNNSSSPSLRSEQSNHNKFGDSNFSKSRELKDERPNTFKPKSEVSNTGGDSAGAGSSKACASFSSTERPKIASNDPVTTAHAARFEVSFRAPYLASRVNGSVNGNSDSSLKCGKAENVRSKIVSNKPVTAAHAANFEVSSRASQTYLASSVNGNSDSSLKCGKAENVGAGAVASLPIAGSQSTANGLKSSVLKVVDQIRGPKCGRYSDKGLFPYDLFVKLYNSNKVEMRPCGLINCGNSCYANVVLQCLAFTPPLTAYFVQGLHSKACVHKDWCFTCEFENLILKAKEGKSPISPKGIVSHVQNIGSQLGHGREEDAHEFLRYAIDAMQSVCLKEAGVKALGSFEEETTLIGLTFGGYLRSKIKCMKCHYKSETQERMMDLTVEIEGEVARLEDALKRFTATEILDGDNKYECSRCKSYEKAKKKLTILEAPNVLTIALKRFQSGKFGKLNKPIRFPEILDLAPYMSGTSDKSPIYRLYGVVVHLDIMNASFSGHYVCYVKNIQNKWFKIDDSTVTAVELEKVLTKGAYILLYGRCSPRAPRLIRNSIVSLDPKNKSIASRVNLKNPSLVSRATSTHPSVFQLRPNSIPPDTASVESFFLKFHRVQKILEEDSSSDNFSFTSSNSDEGSCSTDSTRDSTSTDDLSDYIFNGWGSS
ncbi:hypothetical protein Tsubulata_008414 [Turnera subulata]|uniref:ubiquitinyl hydrolase 1 n=1 Tax=Turnera subulata TaxID=218843 RepID=A0A9Q0GBF7_9ROSI|nr:hypothetical protein Tsubulata_008414 [Turnera subulata]